ncbi:unnamed protein product, partial [Polarella glacialis]
HVICAAASDRYFIGVLNARFEKMMLEGSVSYENPNGQNLPLQLVHMPTTLALASMAFVLLVQIAALLLSTVWFREATMLHALLVVCIALKALETAFKGSIFIVLARQGESEVWRFQVWQLLSRLHETAEIMVLLPFALGWRLLRPRLSVQEQRFIGVAAGLPVTLALLQAWSGLGADGPSPQGIASFNLVFFVVK